jgi:predicted acylesterase/phospholipase RssA
MSVKHLVFGGGGPSCFLIYGAVRELNKLQYWNIENIKSIYGCSSGAWLGLLISLGFDWDTLDSYLIKRPWEKLINIGPTEIINSFNTKGLVSADFIKNSVQPVLKARDLDIECTFLEHFQTTNIELHFYTCDINTKILSKVDLSYKTHPDLKIIDGLAMTMAVPILVMPFIINDSCYIDGGILNNFPIEDCIEQQNILEKTKNEILAFKTNWQRNSEILINNESNMLQYLSQFLRKLSQFTSNNNDFNKEEIYKQSNVVECKMEDPGGPLGWVDVFINEEKRIDYINSGVESAKLFLSKIEELKNNKENRSSIQIENFEIKSENSSNNDIILNNVDILNNIV